MSEFIRPEVSAAFRRWFEPALWVAVAAFGLWVVTYDGWMMKVAGAVIMFPAVSLFSSALRKARRPDAEEGPGIVTITERELLYMGPQGGGAVSIDGLISVQIITSSTGPFGEDVHWRFADDAGAQLMIPNGAVGSEGLFDALTPLPGINFETVLTALSSTEDQLHQIWAKPGASPFTPLQ